MDRLDDKDYGSFEINSLFNNKIADVDTDYLEKLRKNIKALNLLFLKPFLLPSVFDDGNLFPFFSDAS